MQKLLPSFPVPKLPLSVCGIFDKPLFLPESNPRVISWHIHSFNERVKSLQEEISSWLRAAGFSIDQRPFLPDVTIARSPFSIDEWKNSFTILPMTTGAIHLYESLGGVNYTPIWSYPLLPPFQEIGHTADIAHGK